jgi:endonuclease IV
MFRKELVTSGLATVATIHAAHGVMKNLEAQKKRHEAVKSGAISKEQERTMQRKADLKNLASIGLAALGIKGAIGEWKEVQEQRKEHKEFEEKCKERHERRIRRSQSAGGSNRNSQGSRSRAASAASMSMNTGHDYGHHASHYYDGNPYGAGDISIDI